MSVVAAKWAKRQRVRTTCRVVLGALADRADKQGQCWPSQATIAADTGLAIRTVRLVLAELTDAGVIHRAARGNRLGGRATDLITLTLDCDFDLLEVAEAASDESPFAADDAGKGGEGYRQIKDGLAAYEGRVSGTTCRGKNLTGTQRNLLPSREGTFQEKALYGGASGAALPDPFGDDAFGPALQHGEDSDDWDLHDLAGEDAR